MQTTPISCRIEAVTVFTSGATVRRVGEVTTAGAPLLAVRITGLPLALDDATVRVAVEALAGASDAADEIRALPVAADLRVVLDVPDVGAAPGHELERALEKARAEQRRVTAARDRVHRELARMQQLSLVGRPPGEEGKPPGASPLEARLALLAFRGEREASLQKALDEVMEALRQASREVARAEAALRRASTARQIESHELRKAVIVSLRGGVAQTAKLAIEYYVPGARWAPAYTARLSADATVADLTMRAVVAQNTGEDWRGVRLTLSTADAQGFTELPELTSMRIGRRQPTPPKTGWRPPPAGAEELYRDYDRVFRERNAALDRSMDKRKTAEFVSTRLGGAMLDDVDGDDDFDLDTSEYADGAMDAMGDEMETSPLAGFAPPPAPPPSFSPPPSSYGSPPAPMSVSAPMPSRRSAPAKKADHAKSRARAPGAPAPDMVFAQSAPRGGGPMDRMRSEPPHSGEVAGYGHFGANTVEGVAQAYHRRELAEEALAAGVVAEDELLAYGDLRMAPPHERARGALALVSRREVYLELIAEQRLTLRFDVGNAIAAAHRRAASVTQRSLPRHHRAARTDRYDYAYVADTPVDVLADGNFHGLPLTANAAPVRMRHVVVPRESADVFRVAEVDNPLASPLLAGPVDVYLGADFLLTGQIEFTPPKGAVELGLGVDQAIKVSRNTSYTEESAGLIRGALILRHEIRVEVANHRAGTIECDVRERVPVITPDEKDIEITVGAAEPAWREYEPPEADAREAGLRGGRVWRVRVGAGEKRLLVATYEVKIAAKNELVGGNRREG